MTIVPLEWYLVLAAALFCVGAYGVLSRRNAIAVLMCVELMLNAVNVNVVAFWRHLEPTAATGQVLALVVFVVAAAEAAVGLALVISIWRTQRTVVLENVDLLRG